MNKKDEMKSQRQEYHRQFKRPKDKKKFSSQTKGSEKGECCTATIFERSMCRSRSYKTKQYMDWCRKYSQHSHLVR